MRKFDIYCEKRKSFIFIQNIMKLKEIFRRFEIFIEKSFQINLFLFIFNTLKFIIKPIIILILSHVIITLNDIFNLLTHNFNKL